MRHKWREEVRTWALSPTSGWVVSWVGETRGGEEAWGLRRVGWAFSPIVSPFNSCK